MCLRKDPVYWGHNNPPPDAFALVLVPTTLLALGLASILAFSCWLRERRDKRKMGERFLDQSNANFAYLQMVPEEAVLDDFGTPPPHGNTRNRSRSRSSSDSRAASPPPSSRFPRIVRCCKCLVSPQKWCGFVCFHRTVGAMLLCVLLVGASLLVYFPRMPEYSVCNRKVNA
jgi:hypothetical protein